MPRITPNNTPPRQAKSNKKSMLTQLFTKIRGHRKVAPLDTPERPRAVIATGVSDRRQETANSEAHTTNPMQAPPPPRIGRNQEATSNTTNYILVRPRTETRTVDSEARTPNPVLPPLPPEIRERHQIAQPNTPNYILVRPRTVIGTVDSEAHTTNPTPPPPPNIRGSQQVAPLNIPSDTPARPHDVIASREGQDQIDPTNDATVTPENRRNLFDIFADDAPNKNYNIHSIPLYVLGENAKSFLRTKGITAERLTNLRDDELGSVIKESLSEKAHQRISSKMFLVSTAGSIAFGALALTAGAITVPAVAGLFIFLLGSSLGASALAKHSEKNSAKAVLKAVRNQLQWENPITDEVKALEKITKQLEPKLDNWDIGYTFR